MFNMMKVSRKIAELRKEKNMTQMELAEKLNISFQAVSNWERGQSMPDISKLPELAQLFDVSIDDLLGTSAPLVNHAAADTMEEYCRQHPVTPEELSEAAPILRPRQIETAFQNIGQYSLHDLKPLLPFLDQGTVDAMARKAEEPRQLMEMAPFVSDEVLAEKADAFFRQGLAIDALLPLLEEEKIDELARLSYEQGKNPVSMLPFLSETALEALADQALQAGNDGFLQQLAPFLDDAFVASIVSRLLSQGKLNQAVPLAPFMDESNLGQLIQKHFKQ